MSSFDSGSGREPIDPDFAGLFRPDDDPSGDGEPHFEPIVDPVVDPRAEAAAVAEDDAIADAVVAEAESDSAIVAAPAGPLESSAAVPADPVADTGRLFRSQGVVDHDEAVLALAADRAGRLRTLARQDEAVLPDLGPVVVADAAVDGEAVSAMDGTEAAAESTRRGRRLRGATGGHRARGITGGAVYLIVIGVTLLVAFANVLIADGAIGWPTGLALAVSSVYAALTVRREDDTVAIIVPPVAFLVAALTAGQMFIGSAEGSLLNRAVVAFFTLADNWVWILGSTAAALIIVLVRRRRG